MTVRHRFLIGLLLAANLLVVGYLVAFRHKPPTAATPGPAKKVEKLPSLKLQDDTGREFSTDALTGTPLFIQFINPNVEAQVDSYMRVRTQQLKQPVSWLLVSKDARELRLRLPRDSNDVIVEHDYERLRDSFGVPKCCEEWLLYDSAGDLKASGKYEEESTASRLKHLVDGERPYSTAVLLEMLNSLNDKGVLNQIHTKAARSRSGQAVVAFFSSACTGCPEDFLIDLLRKHSKTSPEIAFLALLPHTYTRFDIDSFKTNLEIPFSVESANAELSRQWLRLNEQYGSKSINGTIVVVSRGKVVSAVIGLREAAHLLERLARKS